MPWGLFPHGTLLVSVVGTVPMTPVPMRAVPKRAVASAVLLRALVRMTGKAMRAVHAPTTTAVDVAVVHAGAPPPHSQCEPGGGRLP